MSKLPLVPQFLQLSTGVDNSLVHPQMGQTVYPLGKFCKESRWVSYIFNAF